MFKKISKFKIIIILLIALIPSIRYLLINGFFEPHDLHHFADIFEMFQAIKSGQFPPRLGPDFLYGYGYPLFNFYYLLPFYIGAFFTFITQSVTTSYKLVFIFSSVVGILGMYLLLREFFSKFASFIGAVLFVYTPYKAVELFVRGAMGEYLGLSLLPFALLGIVKIAKSEKPGLKLISSSAIILAIFIITHNFIWALSLPWILLLALMISKNKTLLLKKFVITLILALGLSAFWLFPALAENKLVSNTTPFPLADHFPFLKQLIIPSWGYGASVWGPNDGLSFQIGIVNLAVLIISLFILFSRRNKLSGSLKKVLIWSQIGFWTSFIFMNSRTYPIWKIIPFHDFIQFPWRLLMYTCFFTAVLGAFVSEYFKKQKFVGLLIALFSIILTFSYFQPSKVFYKNDNDYLSRFFANRTFDGYKGNVSKDYLSYSEDYLLLPKWVDKKPDHLPASKIEVTTGLVTNTKMQNSVNWTATEVSNESTLVTFNELYFPGWRAFVNGKEVPINIGKPYGQIIIPVDKGTNNIQFIWQETNLRKIFDLTSIVTFGVCLYLFLRKTRKSKEFLKNSKK